MIDSLKIIFWNVSDLTYCLVLLLFLCWIGGVDNETDKKVKMTG